MIEVDAVFWPTLAASIGLSATLLLTLVAPSLQVWPPPGRDTWPYRLTWTLFALSLVGFLVVGGLDAGSLGLRRWIGEAGTLIVGYVVLTDSHLAAIVGAVGAVWFLLAPFAEEPWLEEQYGAAYRRYRQQCPRFLGGSSFQTRSPETT
jgi:hypothetical protein